MKSRTTKRTKMNPSQVQEAKDAQRFPGVVSPRQGFAPETEQLPIKEAEIVTFIKRFGSLSRASVGPAYLSMNAVDALVEKGILVEKDAKYYIK